MARRRKNGTDLLLPVLALVGLWAVANPEPARQVTDLFYEIAKIAGIAAATVGLLYVIYVRFGKRQSRPSAPARDAAEPFIGPPPARNGEDADLHSHWKPETPARPADWSKALIDALEWRRFEELCAGYFEEKGYRVETTRHGADGGVDIQIFKPGRTEGPPLIVVQCKAWNTYRVGVKPVRELFGVMAAAGVPMGIFITSGTYTQEARDFSEGKHLKLLDGTALLELVHSLPEESQEKLLAKVTRGDYTTPSCPSCGTKMVMRSGGKSTGRESRFWGCRNFPRCRNTLRLKAA